MKKKFAPYLAGILLLSGVGCKEEKNTDVTVYMPDGAPALAMAKMLFEDKPDDGTSYFVVPPAKIATVVAFDDHDKNADLCVMPVTAAAKNLGLGEKYRMLGTVTRGNLYMLGRTEEEISLGNLSSLIGKRVGVVQLAEVPGLTLKAVLTKNGVPWQECREGVPVSENKVNLFALTGADAIDETSNLDYWMAGEPAVSNRVAKGLYRVGDLQAWYGGGYTQAVLLAKTEVIQSRSAWVQDFWSDLQASRDWVLQAEGATLVSVVTAHLEDKNGSTTLNAPLLTGVALAHCGIEFHSASESKEETQAFLRDILTVNQNATALPNDAFYYHGVAQK